ncbi:MAG: chorismate synthase [Candidatus Omnitrophica bacterium]|nr:chorismate synthase [Candidatus Omnitrophota bacterium]
MLNFMTSGESHGHYLIAILEGMPSGLAIDLKAVNHELARRQEGYGRGGRMKIETDQVELASGIYKGKTTGAPIGILSINKDFKIESMPELDRPRPGHADLVGSLKYHEGIRPILERASARETLLRVAIGGITRQLLNEFGIMITSHVFELGGINIEKSELSFEDIEKNKKDSQLNCTSTTAEKKMIALIDQAQKDGDTLGGRFEVRVKGLPMGLGSHVTWHQKLDGRIARAIISAQAVKEIGFGLSEAHGSLPGSQCHDEIFYEKSRGYFRKTNRSGGFEGGMTTGEEIVIRATMKPISTLRKALQSVNMKTKEAEKASFERSDTCAVPACSVICESIVAYEVANAFLEKFGGDSMAELRRNVDGYLKQIKS